MSDLPNRPRAFLLDEGQKDSPLPPIRVEEQPDAFEEPRAPALPEEEAAVEKAQRVGVLRSALGSWSGLFWSAVGALVSLALGLWVDSLVEALFRRFEALGWIAVVLLGVAGLALLVLAGREIAGVARQKRIAGLHARLAAAHLAKDRNAARTDVRALAALYVRRPRAAAARRRIESLTHEIVDARDLIEIAERDLLADLDDRARAEVARAAKRVSVLTTVSPRALIDVLFVAAQALKLVRSIAEIYGGRPGLLGLFRIGRSVAAHLAITGGMAVGDSLVQQVVGHGLAARLSARLGEGVLNGLLTTRVGLSAIAVCRPAPFLALKQPRAADVAPFLFERRGEPRG